MRGRTATAGLYQAPRLKRTIRRWAKEKRFDAVVVFCSSMWQYAEVHELSDLPIVADLVDVDSQKWFDYAAGASGWRRWLYGLEGRRVQRLEGRIAQRAKAITLVSEAEAELFRGVWPNDKTLGVPNGVDLEYFNPDAVQPVAERFDCVFVGQLDYHPNVEGVRWFCQNVWPEIIREHPGATFAIVGRQPVAEVQKLAEQPGVRLIGEVPDIRPYLAAATIAVAPLQIARGIQNKVLEAMAMGVPVVASPGALAGLDVTEDDHAVSAGTPSDWVSALLDLLPDVARRRRLAERGRQFVVRRHSWQSCLAPLVELMRRPGGGEANLLGVYHKQ
ncbi:MAG: TIGR03087 family PEP-CTERM/XrtA system glycosyltransferase [Planctomycetes bacterium]|nr:TIGR03087 family PEP-CTERM/XrtA system glycosyltransferase [Planctomycetota bacterium]